MRFWLALTGILLFAAGSAVGVAGARWMAPSPPAHDLSQFLPFNDGFAEREDLLANLGLSEEQKRKLDELKEKNKKDLAHLRDEFRKTSEALRADFMAVLTAPQRLELEELKAERERKRIEDRVRRDLARMGEDTGIPDDRRALMFPILLRAELEKWEVFKTCSQKEEVERRVEDIRKRRDGEIEKILGSDYPKYKDSKERRRKGWGRGKDGRRDGPPGGPPPGPPPGAESKDPGKLQPAPQ